MGQTSTAYRIQIIAAIIAFFDVFALGFMQSFLALFVAEEFGVNLVEATFWTGIALLFKQLSQAMLSPVWGWLSDRVGSKKMLIRVMAGHSIAHFLMFLSRNVYEFTAFLCVDGMLGSMTTPIFTLLAKTTEPKKLPQVLSYNQSMQNVGSLLAPGVGVALVYYLGYRPTYLMASLIFAGLVLMIMFLRYEEPLEVPERAEEQVDGKVSYLRFIILDFMGLMTTAASLAFINPMTPLCLQTLGVVEKAQLLYYTSLLATMSSLVYMVANPIGTRYVKRELLPTLALGAVVMALAQSPLSNVTIFFILSIGIRAIQAPIQSNLIGGGGRRRRMGTHIGILQTGQRIGSAIGPFIATTMATTVSLTAAFMSMAGIQFMSSVLLFLRNRRLKRTNHDTGQEVL